MPSMYLILIESYPISDIAIITSFLNLNTTLADTKETTFQLLYKGKFILHRECVLYVINNFRSTCVM